MRKIVTLIFALMMSMSLWGAPTTIVIDAGHGGHDTGAPGAVSLEKDINLEVALRLGKELKNRLGKDIDIIYTRDKDYFVTLLDRAQIANKAKADLFVSIHCNSIGNVKRRNAVQGASVYVRGFASSKAAQEVALRENAVVELEDHSKIDTSIEESLISELVWNKNLDESISLAENILSELVNTAGRKRGYVEQNDLAVLKRTKMPAVLVELEFICNPTMEKFMASDSGQNKFAKALANGIIAYRYGGKTPQEQPTYEPVTTNENTSKRDDNNDAIEYRIQFLTSDKQLSTKPELLRDMKDVDYYRDGNVWKYTTGHYPTRDSALKELKNIRKQFADAFVVKFKGGKRIK